MVISSALIRDFNLTMLHYCQGINVNMAYVLMNYQDLSKENFLLGKGLLMLTALSMLCMTLFEVWTYVSIFKQRKLTNQNVTKLLTLETINRRQRSSTITLGGQMLVSFAEILTDIGIFVRIFFAEETTFMLVPQLIGIQAAIISLFQIIAAPEIRRYLASFFE